MKNLPRVAWTGTVCLAAAMLLAPASAWQRDDKNAPRDAKDQDARPKLTLKAQPMMAIAPARVVFSAELTGGANDAQEYYCPTVEWAWGDDTRSEATSDCEPYQPGKSEIKRRFTVEHQYKHGGNFKIVFRLKRGNKAIATASINVQVRPGLRDIG
jgi:hypothetical protein